MKRFLSLLMSICLLLSMGAILSACDEDSKKEEEGSSEGDLKTLSQAEWEVMLQDANFYNVTFAIDAIVLEGLGVSSGTPYKDEIKVDGDKALIEGEVETNPETIQSVVNVYFSLATAIVKDYSKFEYDAQANLYVAKEAIVFPVTVAGINANITATDVKLSVSADNKIASVSCIMRQDIDQGEQGMTIILDSVLSFSNYGTTVVE